jgi:hypothetical protein
VGEGRGIAIQAGRGLREEKTRKGEGEARRVDGVRCDMVCLITAEAGADFIRAAKPKSIDQWKATLLQ